MTIIPPEGVRITKRGTPPDEREWRGDCKHCGSRVEAKQSVVKITPARDQRDCDSGRLDCPVCGAVDGILLLPTDNVWSEPPPTPRRRPVIPQPQNGGP